jgi:Domain of unknown function (DUF4249)
MAKTSISLLFILFLSCQNLDNFDVNTVKEPLIVVQANLIARQSPSIYVSKLWGATAPRPRETFYRDADVELFENGKSVGKLFLKDTLYQNPNYIIKPNTKYVIKASVQGIKSIESEPVLIPADGVISGLTYLEKSPVNSAINQYQNPSLVSVMFKKDDRISGYGVQLLLYDKDDKKYEKYDENIDLGTETKVKSPCLFGSYCADVDVNGNIKRIFYNGRTAYLSKCIDTEEKQVRFIFGSRIPVGINVVAVITAASQEGVEQSRTSRVIEGFTGSLSEPYPAYSNIKGGLGIVIGYNVTYKVLTIK